MGLFNLFGKKDKEQKKMNANDIAEVVFSLSYMCEAEEVIDAIESKQDKKLPEYDRKGLDSFLSSLAMAVSLFEVKKRYSSNSKVLIEIILKKVRDYLNKAGKKPQFTEFEMSKINQFFKVLQKEQEEPLDGDPTPFIDSINGVELAFGYEWEGLDVVSVPFIFFVGTFMKNIKNKTIHYLSLAEQNFGFKPPI
jgi:hypothetical protein